MGKLMMSEMEANSKLLMPENKLYTPQILRNWRPTRIFFYSSEDGNHCKSFRPTEAFLRNQTDIERQMKKILKGQITLTILEEV